jgi:hypothetical protein
VRMPSETFTGAPTRNCPLPILTGRDAWTTVGLTRRSLPGVGRMVNIYHRNCISRSCIEDGKPAYTKRVSQADPELPAVLNGLAMLQIPSSWSGPSGHIR